MSVVQLIGLMGGALFASFGSLVGEELDDKAARWLCRYGHVQKGPWPICSHYEELY